MKGIWKYCIFAGITSAALYNIIEKLWKMAEVKLYGWSQASAVDTLAAAFIAVVVSVALALWAWFE